MYTFVRPPMWGNTLVLDDDDNWWWAFLDLNRWKFMMFVSTVAIRKAMWAQLLSDPSTLVIWSLRTFIVAVDVWVDNDDDVVDDLWPTVWYEICWYDWETPEWYILTTDRWIDSALSLPMKLSTTQMPYFSKSRPTRWHMSMSHSILYSFWILRNSESVFWFLMILSV